MENEKNKKKRSSRIFPYQTYFYQFSRLYWFRDFVENLFKKPFICVSFKKKYSHKYLELNKVRITLFGFPPRPRLHRRTCPLSSPPPPFPANATVTSAALSSLPPLFPAAPSFKEGEGEASTNRRREQDLRRGGRPGQRWVPFAAGQPHLPVRVVDGDVPAFGGRQSQVGMYPFFHCSCCNASFFMIFSSAIACEFRDYSLF